ncbi:uncharacterized protein LOC131943989 [Physella acuta]|uniref:uncharacterized protein LOC131943989 n=1 Tax=Physella acuta TaxID=109671 RepID=UPI0027DDFF2E|nr:uncharacterized protein LOC131943989 [Physella acuta]
MSFLLDSPYSPPSFNRHIRSLVRHDLYTGSRDDLYTGSWNVSRPTQQEGVVPGTPREGDRSNSSVEKLQQVKSLTPLPDWGVALERWGVWWELHVYGFSVLFLILTVVSAAVFIRFRLRVRKLKIVFNTLLLLATSGLLRALFMLLDPYGYKSRMPELVVGILTQGVYPLFCACYGLTQVMLLRVTKVDVGNSKVRSLSWLMGCTLTYLFLVVIIESLVSFERSLKLLLLLDSGCFIAWALYLSITFICSGFRLTQYATETKRARKELNAFSNNRRGNTNGATTPTDAIGHVDFPATTPDSPPFPVTLPVCAEINPAPPPPHKPNSNLRLSRPKLKISEKDHMMVTIATDDDDVSTSSTDVETSKDDNSRRQKKGYKHVQKTKSSRMKSKSSGPYVPLPLADDQTRKKPATGETKTRSKSGRDAKHETISPGTAALSTVEAVGSYSVAYQGSSTHYLTPTHTGDNLVDVAYGTVPELPLLQPPDVRSTEAWNTLNEVIKCEPRDSLDEDDEGDNPSPTPHTQPPAPPDTAALEAATPTVGTDFPAESWPEDTCERSVCATAGQRLAHQYEVLAQAEQTISNHLDHASGSPRDNGYLADTENIFYCTTFSKASNSLHRQPSSRDDVAHLSGDLSSQRSTPSHSDDESTTSAGLSERMRTMMPAALSLFRIRQSKVVQRAVHLTYFLTFLFMFACLLQLYTVFGVYGVLGTIPRPDPWPWLIFHTIFRATEFSIGLTTAFIAFFSLNHRHQRTRRRLQQQQQVDHTRDCVV